MYEDLDRIRYLETRMRKRQLILPASQNLERKEEEPLLPSKDKEHNHPQQQNSAKINIPPKIMLHSVDVNSKQLPEGDFEDNQKKNKKLTDFFKERKQIQIQLVISPSPKLAEARKNRDAKLMESTEPAVPYLEIADENKSLRERLRQREQQYIKDKKKLKDMLVNYAVENHRYERSQIRAKISSNKMRLGEYIIHKDNGKITEMWMDGQEIKNLKEKIDDIVKKKVELEKELKNLKTKKDSQILQQTYDPRILLTCQISFLNKDEQALSECLSKLEDQKSVHIKDFKRLYEEDNSKYGKSSPTTGITNWPKINNYQLLCLLGKGGFCEVYKAFDTEQLREVACKIHEFDMKWADDAKDNYIRHAIRQNNVQKQLKHPNIVTLYNTVEIDRMSFITVMQYCNGPDLSYYLRKHKCIPEKQAKLMIKQILYAIKYMHQLLPEKIIHYDLKPQNILFHNGQLKITDFGLCKTMKMGLNKMQLTSQGVGTYWYLPPECFIENSTITPKVDIWSIGVIYYQMLFHQKPFGNNMSQLRILKENIILKSKNTPLEFPDRSQVSDESKNFIRDCLKYNDVDRMDANTALNHPLFYKD